MLARALPGGAVLVSADRHLAGRPRRDGISAAPCTCSTTGSSTSRSSATSTSCSWSPTTSRRPACCPSGRLREPVERRCAWRDALVVDGRGVTRDAAAAACSACRTCSASCGRPGPLHPSASPGDDPPAAWHAAWSRSPGSRGPRGSSTTWPQTAGRWRGAGVRRSPPVHAPRTSPACAQALRVGSAAGVVTTEKDWCGCCRSARSRARSRGAACPATVEPAAEFGSGRRAWLRRAHRRTPPRTRAQAGPREASTRVRGSSSPCASCVRLLPVAAVRGIGDGARAARSTRSIARTAAWPLDNLATRLPASAPPTERRAIARRDVRALRAVAVRVAQVQHAQPPIRCSARVEFEGDERVRPGLRAQGKGVLFFTGHFGFWEMHGDRARAALEPIGVLARAARQPACCTTLLERVRAAHGQLP